VPVENRIIKVQKRNRALVTFDQSRIQQAILRAAKSIGGLKGDFLPGINDHLFNAFGSDEKIAEFLSDVVVVCLNSEPQHLISNFPPTIEMIQDLVIHVLRSYGFQNTADAYVCYRWGRHWLREGAITADQFMGNGYPTQLMNRVLEWNRARGCDTVEGLNEIVRKGQIKDLIRDCIDRYESELDHVAQKVIDRLNKGAQIRMLWIAGPSSSGKTTTTVKLTERLEKQGLRFLMLNLDDYFWSVVEHPTDWINDRNFETPEALDIQLLNQHLKMLLDGQPIDKPTYSFKEGRRVATKRVQLQKDQILLLDCLHGLYPPITEGIDPSMQFRVYVENLNVIYEGDGSTKRICRFTDVRLLRRIIRDALHRNHKPLLTILHWHYVRAGELYSIIPLMGLADYVINGGMAFELPVLKPFFEGPDSFWPTPEEIRLYPTFLDAQIRYRRVSELLGSVHGLTRDQVNDLSLIPGDALIREFIGGHTIKIPHNE